MQKGIYVSLTKHSDSRHDQFRLSQKGDATQCSDDVRTGCRKQY
jgi:hypothetical protein